MSARARPWIRQGIALCLGLKALLLALGVMAVEAREDRPVRTASAMMALWDRPEPRGSVPDAALPWAESSWAWVAATLVSLAPGLLLYALASRDEDPSTAWRAQLALLLSPGAFVLHLPWRDSAFLGLCVAAFLCARLERFGAVAVLGFLAGCLRIEGAILAPALAAEAWASSEGHRRIRHLLAVCGSLAGTLMASAATSATMAQRTAPNLGLHGALALLEAGGEHGTTAGLAALGAAGFLLLASLAAVTYQRWSYIVWTLGLTLAFTTRPVWTEGPRFALAAFPAFILLGRVTQREPFGTFWFAGSTLLLSFLATQFALGRL